MGAEGLLRGGVHLEGGAHVTAIDAGMVGGKVDGTGDEVHGHAPAGELHGDGDALSAGGAVANEAHGVHRFVGGPDGDEGPIAQQGGVVAEPGGEFLPDADRVGHAALALKSAGQLALLGLDDVDAPAAERVKVGGGGRMGEHVAVHGRGDDHRAFGAEQDRQQEAVPAAFHHAGEGVCRGRRHQDDIAPETELDVVRPRAGLAVVGQLTVDGVTAQRAEGQGRDEFPGARRHDDADLRTGLDQFADEKSGFVGGDAPGHTQDDPSALQHRHGRDQSRLNRRLRRSSRSRRISS